jgi:hypothetical protein
LRTRTIRAALPSAQKKVDALRRWPAKAGVASATLAGDPTATAASAASIFGASGSRSFAASASAPPLAVSSSDSSRIAAARWAASPQRVSSFAGSFR